MTESLPAALPTYVGTGPADRVLKLLAAIKADRDTDRSPVEPEGILGWRGTDGYYHELTEADLFALAGEVVRNAIEPPQANPYSRHADADGYLRGIARIVNTVTGELVTLPEPIDVHVRDIDRVIDEYQARFLAEWEAGREANR